jgi:hypothetical protein
MPADTVPKAVMVVVPDTERISSDFVARSVVPAEAIVPDVRR